MAIQKRMQDFYFEIESPEGKKEVIDGNQQQSKPKDKENSTKPPK